MTGDENDVVQRLQAVLPPRWFANPNSVLTALLLGLASSWAWIYQLLGYVLSQTRIATASGIWLDLIAQDCFGRGLPRRISQPDQSYRWRIQQELLRERGTRGSLTAVLQGLTGRTPTIFEPARPADTAAWGVACGYGSAGAWGNLDLPFQCFVTAYRPQGSGIAVVAGWGSPTCGWGIGALEYASLEMLQGQVTDSDINDVITSVLPVAAVAWTRITN